MSKGKGDILVSVTTAQAGGTSTFVVLNNVDEEGVPNDIESLIQKIRELCDKNKAGVHEKAWVKVEKGLNMDRAGKQVREKIKNGPQKIKETLKSNGSVVGQKGHQANSRPCPLQRLDNICTKFYNQSGPQSGEGNKIRGRSQLQSRPKILLMCTRWTSSSQQAA